MSNSQKKGGVDRSRKVGGYNPPPVETRFKKGQKPPKGAGRPISKHISQIAKEYGEQPHGKTGKTKDEHAMEVLYRRGCQGDDRAMSTWLAYRWGRPVEQTVNLNADLNKPIATLEQIREQIQQKHQAMGFPPTVLTITGREVDREAVRSRVSELLEKRRQKALPAPQIVPGSEALQ